jgi:hypothetical protein
MKNVDWSKYATFGQFLGGTPSLAHPEQSTEQQVPPAQHTAVCISKTIIE